MLLFLKMHLKQLIPPTCLCFCLENAYETWNNKFPLRVCVFVFKHAFETTDPSYVFVFFVFKNAFETIDPPYVFVFFFNAFETIDSPSMFVFFVFKNAFETIDTP